MSRFADKIEHFGSVDFELREVLEVVVHPLVVDPGVLVCQYVPESRHLDHLSGHSRREDVFFREDLKQVSVVQRFTVALRRDDVRCDVETRLDGFLEATLDDVLNVAITEVLLLRSILFLPEPSYVYLE